MHIYLLAAQSIDGYIAQDPTVPSTSWTSSEDAQFFSEKTKEIGTLVMGRRTFETIGRALPHRTIIVLSAQSKPSQYAHIPDSAVTYIAASPQQLISLLDKRGVQSFAVCGGTQVYSQFLQADLVDTAFITTEPVLFGYGNKLWDVHATAPMKFCCTEQKTLNDAGTMLCTYERTRT